MMYNDAQYPGNNNPGNKGLYGVHCTNYDILLTVLVILYIYTLILWSH